MVEQFSPAAAPAVDRLLHITNAEEGARAIAVSGDFFSEKAEHAPLIEAGVLKLIEQQMTDGTIEAIADFGEQRIIALGQFVCELVRKIAVKKQPLLLAQANVVRIKAMEQVVGGLRLSGDISEQRRFGMLDQRHEDAEQIRIDRLPVEHRIHRISENLRRQSLLEKCKPVAAHRAVAALLNGIDQRLGRGRRKQRAELIHQFAHCIERQRRRRIELLPVMLLGNAVGVVKLTDDVIERLRDRSASLIVVQSFKQINEQIKVFIAEHRFDGLRAQSHRQRII